MKRLLFFVLVFCIALVSYAQDTIPKKHLIDTVRKFDIDINPDYRTDSVENGRIYSSIHNVAKKRRWLKSLHNLVFDYQEPKAPELTKNKSIEDDFIPYTGLAIRNINIINLSPFGSNVDNPDSIRESALNKAFNSLHVNTQDFIIKNSLLFKKGDLVDPYAIAETEAYLRSLAYISDALIRISKKDDVDSVDISVIVHDRFSIGFHIHNVSFSRYDVELYDRNFIGLGTELRLRYMNNKNEDPPIGFGAGLIANNTFNTFIRTELSYLNNFEEEVIKISAERAMHPTLKYLGGISYLQEKKPHRIDLTNDTVNIRKEQYSLTFGRTFDLGAKKYRQKLIVAGRFLRQNNLSDLVSSPDYKYLNYSFERKSLWIAAISLFRQKHYRSNMIYNFGTTEDIALGYNITAQVGYEKHAYFNRMYGSISAAGSKLFKYGYFYTKASFGSYFRSGREEQGILRFYSSYFSPLYKLGNNHFRQFISIDYTEGIRRLESAGERIYFSHLTNFKTTKFNYEANGTRRFVFNTETDWFSPLKILGFRMVPFAFVNLAWLGDQQRNLFHKRNFFSGYGIGIRTRNEQLVFKIIELKLAWYPQLNQHKISDYYNLSTSNPNVSANFKPDYPNIIPFE